MRIIWGTLFFALLYLDFANADVLSGKVSDFAQYPNMISINDEHFNQTEIWKDIDLEIAWSSAGNINKTGYLYAGHSETLIADTQGIEDICEIQDASKFSYSRFTLGKFFVVGKIYLFYNPRTKFYAAFKVLSHIPDGSYGDQDQLTGVWYLQSNQGLGNFSCQ